MKRLAISLALIALAGTAQARSNIETSVIKQLRISGVPESCIAKVTLSDAAQIRSWHNAADTSDGEKNRRIADIIDKICER